MRACFRCAAAAVPARRARRHLEPWHAARGAGRFAAARAFPRAPWRPLPVRRMCRRRVSLRAVTRRAKRDASPSPRVQRTATPMRGLTGKHHPSVNLPPLRLPRCAEGEDGFSKSGASGEDGFLVVGRDFNRARFDPVANSKFLDDRPWDAVDAFARDLVLGEACLTSLVDATCVHRPESARADARKDLFAFRPASPCDGEGVDPERRASAGRARRYATPNTPAHVPVLGAVLRPGVRRLGVARGGREVLRRRALVRPGAFSAAAATQKALAPLFATQTPRTPRGRCGARGARTRACTAWRRRCLSPSPTTWRRRAAKEKKKEA